MKLKFTYQEQKEFEIIDDVIAGLEAEVEALNKEMLKNATNSAKLSELTLQIEEKKRQLDEKTERWVYLNELAEKIESQNQ